MDPSQYRKQEPAPDGSSRRAIPVFNQRSQQAGQLINAAIDDGLELYYDTNTDILHWRDGGRGVPEWTELLPIAGHYAWLSQYEEEIKELANRHGKQVSEPERVQLDWDYPDWYKGERSY